MWVVLQEGSKEWKRCEAKIRRMVTPAKRSGNVAASPEILKKWSLKGGPRKDLVRMMVKVKGDKDLCIWFFGFFYELLCGLASEPQCHL